MPDWEIREGLILTARWRADSGRPEHWFRLELITPSGYIWAPFRSNRASRFEYEDDYDQILCYGISFFKRRCMMKKKWSASVKNTNHQRIDRKRINSGCYWPHALSLTCSYELSPAWLIFCHQPLQGCRLDTGGNKFYVVMVPSISCSTTYLII